MNLQEVAALLGLSDQVIARWVRQGNIPCLGTGSNPVFDEQEIRKWARNHNMVLGPGVSSTEKAQVSLAQAMREGGVVAGIQGMDIPRVLESLVNTAPIPGGIDRAVLLLRLLEREKLASTGLGHGVAVPHPRIPLEDTPPYPLVTTAFLDTPIDYESVDRVPVSVLCMIISPSPKVHLHLLSRLGHCFRDNAFLSFLQSRPEPEALFEEVQRLEGLLDGKRPS